MSRKTYVGMIHWRVERLAFRSYICINGSIPKGLISSIFTTHCNSDHNEIDKKEIRF
jgi:hypothetical protein